MSQQPATVTTDTEKIPFWQQHRLLLLLVISISITFVLTGISMALYIGSGASQLDLSRPGYYQSMKDQAEDEDEAIKEYADSGLLSQEAITEFKELYSEQANLLIEANAFSGEPLDPRELGLIQE